MDEVLKDDKRVVVPILRDAMGLDLDVEGPVWMRVPPVADRRTFFDQVELPQGAHVFVVPGLLHAERVRDVHGREIPGLTGLDGEGFLFFVDLAPLANWAHECEYHFVQNGTVQIAPHRWPPAESLELRPYLRSIR